MKVLDLDKRIIELLKNRGYQTDKEINEFLNPDFSMLLNPFGLDGMAEAVSRIKEAVEKKQKIVIYGDYDCDGISACVILYKYFLSIGIKCDVYIPSRFDDGYGLSFELIDEVLEKSKPDLIITVDLGVTAVEEVEKIKNAGVDIIVTDHHEPAATLPDCITIDPKKTNQKYAFNGLCGAGVALKLVEALAGVEVAKEYLDVCAIATIGDIVPLVSENRVIAKYGIEKFNSEKCLPSYKFMINELGLKKLNATDITFKIVPRINASGRMDKAIKVFNFLIETDKNKLSELFKEMMKDNEVRLSCINEGVENLEKQMQNINLAKDNIILLHGQFHQGVLGILASRICHDYNRPAIIFSEAEDGSLKGSGRSLEGINLHQALDNVSHLLLRFGGHKMAVGVEVEKNNFEALKKALSAEISKQATFKTFSLVEKYDIKINENDINANFIKQLEMLEPYGCQNERPTLMLEVGALNVTQMKDNFYKHFKLSTSHGKQIMAFSSEKHILTLKSPVKKHLIVELENNEYKGKVYPQAVLKNVYLKELKIEEDKEKELMISLICKFLSQNIYLQKGLNEYEFHNIETVLSRVGGSGFGTIVVVDSASVATRLKTIYPKLKNYTISHVPLKNKQNVILVSHRMAIDSNDFVGYNNIVFTRQIFNFEKNIFAQNANVYIVKGKTHNSIKLDNSRNVNIQVYNILKKYAGAVKANNVFEWVEKIQQAEGGLSKAQILFSTLSFAELGFIDMELYPNFNVSIVESPPKKELSSSRFMNKISHMG